MKHLLITIIFLTFLTFSMNANNPVSMEDNSNKLAILWTSGDADVAEKVCFMYTYNAKKQGWFDDVVLIVWGPSSKLLSENEDLQAYVKKMQDVGIKVEACVACANMYGIADDLRALDIDVKGMGVPLTNYLKQNWKTLNF